MKLLGQLLYRQFALLLQLADDQMPALLSVSFVHFFHLSFKTKDILKKFAAFASNAGAIFFNANYLHLIIIRIIVLSVAKERTQLPAPDGASLVVVLLVLHIKG